MAGLLSSVLSRLSLSEQGTDTGPLTEDRLRQWLTERVATQLKIAPAQVDTSRNFESYGLDSMAAIKLAGDLEKVIERRLSPALLFEHPNIDALAAHLAGELALSEMN